jgi:spore maturation protein A
MLNYIWAGLIIASLVFAVLGDARDIATDTFRNDAELPLVLELPDGYQPDTRRVNVNIWIDPALYGRFYDTDARPDSVYPGYIVRTRDGTVLRFASGSTLPEPLATIHSFSSTRDDELQGELGPQRVAPDSSFIETSVTFDPVRFVRLNNITQAAFDFAETAATLALGLIGVLALFLGLLKIAEAAGIVAGLVRFTQPVFRPLFPDIPDGHPALGMIVLNLTANMLGLGNAATPLGIRAMEELQKLNPEKETATNSMVMLLALNTASVQLVPPTLLVAVMGLQVNELILPIIVVTFISAVVAVTSAKLLQRVKAYRETDPHRHTRTDDVPETNSDDSAEN